MQVRLLSLIFASVHDSSNLRHYLALNKLFAISSHSSLRFFFFCTFQVQVRANQHSCFKLIGQTKRREKKGQTHIWKDRRKVAIIYFLKAQTPDGCQPFKCVGALEIQRELIIDCLEMSLNAIKSQVSSNPKQKWNFDGLKRESINKSRKEMIKPLILHSRWLAKLL